MKCLHAQYTVTLNMFQPLSSLQVKGLGVKGGNSPSHKIGEGFIAECHLAGSSKTITSSVTERRGLL